MQNWINKLRERNVIQFMLLYAGFIWGFIQVVDFMSEKFDWPVLFVKIVTIVGFSSIPSAFVFFYYRPQPDSLKRQVPFYVANILIVVLIFVYTIPFASKRSDVKIDLDAKQSIAVLPFDDMSPHHDQDWFSDGVMTEIVSHLYKIKGCRVTRRNSSMKFKGKALSPKEIAEQLGVSHVLEGSVRKDSDKVRIQVTLLLGSNETEVWSETYNRELKDIFDIQSDVAQQVAEKLKISIAPDVKGRIEFQSTKNMEAYLLVMRTGQLLEFSKAEKVLEKAISLDPNYAEPYAKLAAYWIGRGGHSGDLELSRSVAVADSLNKKALELDPNNLTAHNNLVSMSLFYHWDFEAAEEQSQILLKVSPSYFSYSTILLKLALGKFEEAVEIAQRMLDNDRGDHAIQSFLAMCQVYNKDSKLVLSVEKFIEFTTVEIAMRHLDYLGNFKKSTLIYEGALKKGDKNARLPLAKAFAAIAYSKTNKSAIAHKLLTELVEKCRSASTVGSPAFFSALVYAAINEKEKALTYLEQGLKKHELEMYWVKVDPFLQSLRGEPRYEAVVKKVFEAKRSD